MTSLTDKPSISNGSARETLRLLNLACGTRMHPEWVNVDFSPYAKLAKRPNLARFLRAVGLISEQRYARLRSVDPKIVCYDLRKRLPFQDNTFDVVYHSHFLEHLERSEASKFLSECRRVLKEGGVLRISVPDLHKLTAWYLDSHAKLRSNPVPENIRSHLARIDDLFDQVVRKETGGASGQRPIVRFLEKVLGHSAKNMGELHKWMYDFYSLKNLLEGLGFHSVQEHTAFASAIRNWSDFNLDSNDDGSVYKPESLFVEARK